MASGGSKKKSGKAGLLEKVLTLKYTFMLIFMLTFIQKDYDVAFSCFFFSFR